MVDLAGTGGLLGQVTSLTFSAADMQKVNAAWVLTLVLVFAFGSVGLAQPDIPTAPEEARDNVDSEAWNSPIFGPGLYEGAEFPGLPGEAENSPVFDGDEEEGGVIIIL